LTGVAITLGPGAWTMPLAPITSLQNGSITLASTSATFPNLTNINGSSLVAGGTASVLALPVLAAYVEGAGFATTFQASGAGNAVNLPSLASITGGSGHLMVNALSGGLVDMPAVTTITARQVQATSSGAGSTIDLSGLSTWSDALQFSTLTVNTSGTVTLNPVNSTISIPITLNSAGTITGGTVQLNAPGSLSGSGGTITATLVNGANVAPGTSPGTITVVGAYTQTGAGTLAVELNGTTPGTQHDQLVVQGTVSLGGTLSISRGYTPTIGESWVIVNNDGADPVVGTFAASPEGDIYTLDDVPLRVSYVGGDGNDVTLTRVVNTVVGRRVFYNQSKFDGNSSAANSSDDAAIATDKSAYLPGSGAATFANITSYSRGINGIMVDLAGPHGAISAADFVFRMSTQVGANNTPSTWAAAPAPVTVTVRDGAGYRGADRLEITWTDGAIANRWLEVISEGNDAGGGFNTNTGLPASDIFFFGNRMGDTGSGTATLAITSALDELAARGNPGAGATVTNLFDFDRSGLVNAVDNLIARNNAGTLTKINISSPPAAPETTGDGGVALAVSVQSDSDRQQSATGSQQALPTPTGTQSIARTSAVVGQNDTVGRITALESALSEAAIDVAIGADDSLLDLLIDDLQ
jgi:hypothetical protein